MLQSSGPLFSGTKSESVSFGQRLKEYDQKKSKPIGGNAMRRDTTKYDAIEEKLELVEDYDLKGTAIFKVDGEEGRSVWRLF